ncbi:Hypothetical predicted protein [Pelobates cultripes]|uniref:Uncharacterized protein n=1 Tax=Pelobates cultripes TaxID=61616 RepID=A0AAD1S6P9_PELCU|nr:Hypothetical predicted protein [Pelobates cultripes]
MSKKVVALMDPMGNENSYVSKVQHNTNWNIFEDVQARRTGRTMEHIRAHG